MPFSRILAAYDGSKLSRKALDKAIDIAEHYPEAELHVLHVIQYPVMVLGEAMISASAEVQKEHYDKSEQLLEEVRQLLQTLPVKSQTSQLVGQPAPAILEYANTKDCNLIVLGSRGVSNLHEIMLGSVSHDVVQHSKVPVLVVK
ncbi:MAG: universal stress protein [Gorillibacterium sp.]|nr:universal stress protein [Gorillibacterium sp.]